MRPFSYLLWSYGAPQWLRDGGYSTAKRVSFAQQFVTATMTRYRGQIKAWQVFNEPVWATVYGSPEQRFWQDSLGADFDHFVAEAFHWARAADPSATLLLTDYVNEGRDLQVTQSFYNLVEELVAGGTPLDAVGIETHFHWEYDNPAANPQFSPQVFADWIGKYQQLGVEVWITEFDVDMTGFVGTKQAEFAVQAQWYRDYLQAALDHGVTNFTIFGLTDNTSWYNLTGRPNASALILNSDFTPKPAYFAVRDVLKKRAGLT
jgi:endo-1,4-beta-xylanase